MKLLSLNIGHPQAIEWQEKTIQTSIFKSPVERALQVSFLNIEGDAQADLRFHGGRDKAIYSYDLHYYQQWQQELPQIDWSFGMFGENLTTQGLTEDSIQLGNIYRVGTALIQAVQPRVPCFKLNVRFQRKDMLERFFHQRCYGTYFRVLEEGKIQAGQSIELVELSPYTITIADVVEAFYSKGSEPHRLQQILDIPILPDGIRKNLSKFKQQS